MQVILDSSFARPGSAPIWGGKKGEFRDWTKVILDSTFARRGSAPLWGGKKGEFGDWIMVKEMLLLC